MSESKSLIDAPIEYREEDENPFEEGKKLKLRSKQMFQTLDHH